jgi:Na+/H+ antiporter NhaD/arsenite permease-like protein
MMRKNILKRIFLFYYEGFRNMTVGKKLWALILIKLFIMFVILKLFFFKDFLNEKFDTEEEKSEYVLEQLTKPKNTDND